MGERSIPRPTQERAQDEALLELQERVAALEEAMAQRQADANAPAIPQREALAAFASAYRDNHAFRSGVSFWARQTQKGPTGPLTDLLDALSKG